MVEVWFLAIMLLLLIIGALVWLGRRAWALAFRPYEARHYRPRADQIANQEAVDAYWARRPRIHSFVHVRRGRPRREVDNSSENTEQ